MAHMGTMSDDPQFRSTSRSLPIALLRAREAVMGPFRPLLARADVTEQQWRVLRVLDERGRMDPSGIAQGACLLMPSLTRILRGLEARGLVERLPHESDRRTFCVQITEAGHALIAAHRAESNRIFSELEARYGAGRIEQLLDLLSALDDKH
jgi:homoprotocatechuate degradation regulator HpaR